MNYCHIENGEVDYAGHLPKNWNNISGINLLEGDDAQLKNMGWLPMEEIVPIYDHQTHYRKEHIIDIQDDKVVYTANILAFTAEQIKQNVWNDWVTSMLGSDREDGPVGIDRNMELLIEHQYDGVAFDEKMQERYNKKKTLRATRPEKPE